MTMHLEGPWLSTTGRRKGKHKWASAEAKRQHEQLERDWQDLKKKYAIEDAERKRNRGLSATTYVPPKLNHRTTDHIPSHKGGAEIGNATKAAPKVYTGTKIIGIGTMHKSNAVPIFSDSEAKDISSMRR